MPSPNQSDGPLRENTGKIRERDRKTDRGKVDGEKKLRGSSTVGFEVGGVMLFDQQTLGGEVEKPLMLIVGSGLNPRSD